MTHVILGVAGAITGAVVGNRLRGPVHRYSVSIDIAGEPARDAHGESDHRRSGGRPERPGNRLGARWPIPELATALAVGLVLAVRGLAWDTGAFVAMAVAGSALAMVDIATLRLPNHLTVPLYPVLTGILAVTAAWRHDPAPLLRAVEGMLVCAGFYAVLMLVRPGQLGGGDLKLAGALGLLLGWLGWRTLLTGVFLGFLLASLAGTGILLRRRASLTTALPFGPFMLLGAWLALLAAPR